MRVVLDSNVLVAAVATRGACAELLTHVLARHALGIDANLLGEVERILTTKIRAPADRVQDFVGALRTAGPMLEPIPLEGPVCRDPDDDRILALCRAHRADVLVTGDRDLLVLDPWEGLRIVNPGGFWPLDRA